MSTTPLRPELSTSGLNQAGIDQLVKLYTAALDRMAGIVASPVGRTQSAREFRLARAAMLGRQIDEILAKLKNATAAWTGPALSAAAADGIRRGEQQARDLGVDVDGRPMTGSFQLIDQGTVKMLVKDVRGSMDTAAASAGDRAKHVLRQTAQLGLDEADINRILAGGVIDGQPTATIRNLRDALRAVHGNKVLVNGRNFDVAYYAEMVARTKTREASVMARHERLQSVGLDLVSIVGRVSKNFCTAYLGLVFSLSGKSDKYPALSELPSDGPPFHPNCSKSTRPFLAELASDKQLELAEPTADQKQMLKVDDATAGQRRFQDLQVYTQQKARYASTADKLFGTASSGIASGRTASDKPASRKPTATPAATAPASPADRLQTLLPGAVDLRDVDHPAIQEHLQDLGLVPDALLKRLGDNGVKIRLQATTVGGMDPNLRDVQPRGWEAGKTWNDVPGAYAQANKTVMAGAGPHGSRSLALHELGHAVGDTVQIDGQKINDSAQLIDIHQGVHYALPEYLQQDGPGGLAGRSELWAEGFATYLKKGKSFTAIVYGQRLADLLESVINGDKS